MFSRPMPPAGERVLRRVLHTYWRLSRGLTLGVRGMVLDRDNRVLLIKHSYVAGWHLPGGGVEAGETMTTALRRELQEECGVEPAGTPPLHGIFFNPRDSNRDHVALYVWCATIGTTAFRLPTARLSITAFLPSANCPPTRRRRPAAGSTRCSTARRWLTAGETVQARSKRARSWAALKSSRGPTGTMPVGLIMG
jgi:ADP-ribose pyrophosphatase YjhB (NUDIX family)